MSHMLEVTPAASPTQRFPLGAARRMVLGRTAESDFIVEADPFISRRHIEIGVEDGRLAVKRLASAPNPVVFLGEARDEFHVAPGGTFTIGRTRFVFYVILDGGETDLEPPEHDTMAEQDLYAEGDLDRLRLHDLLELPEVISMCSFPVFREHLARLLRSGTGARWAGVFSEDGRVLARDAGDGVAEGSGISRSIAGRAIESSPRPTLYCWNRPERDFAATLTAGINWAICAAIRVPGQPHLLLYAAGEGGSAQEQRQASRFVGLIAEIVGRSLLVARLESWHDHLRQYFSGAIIKTILETASPMELAPQRTQATVMFFDLRAFSKRMEGEDAEVLKSVGQLREVMTAMTAVIIREQGVVISYRGDGILACWNVPVADAGHVNRACRAALGMLAALRDVPGSWSCGIGLHTGEVVAGAIGSAQVFSYGVLGRVVNEASRLESLTKDLGCQVLVTGAVAAAVAPEVAVPVRVGRFQLAGTTGPLDLFDLTPPPGDPARAVTLARGLEAFEHGEWDAAELALAGLPSADGPARYLRGRVLAHRRRPPWDWNGIIELTAK